MTFLKFLKRFVMLGYIFSTILQIEFYFHQQVYIDIYRILITTQQHIATPAFASLTIYRGGTAYILFIVNQLDRQPCLFSREMMLAMDREKSSRIWSRNLNILDICCGATFSTYAIYRKKISLSSSLQGSVFFYILSKSNCFFSYYV